jgi:hypothetical protein
MKYLFPLTHWHISVIIVSCFGKLPPFIMAITDRQVQQFFETFLRKKLEAHGEWQQRQPDHADHLRLPTAADLVET